MSNHNASFGFSDYGCGTRRDRRILPIVAVSLIVVSGCGVGGSSIFPQPSVEIIRGKDSAGATIELEKWGDDLTSARVIDVVLGTGEGEIVSDEDGHVEFTIDFPAGATITYAGAVRTASESSVEEIAGIWRQHAAGIYADDEGTWSASGRIADKQVSSVVAHRSTDQTSFSLITRIDAVR